MKVVVKKSILFNLLRSSLNESRSGHSFYSDGSFLGRFEEKEEEVDFINTEVPLRASPKSTIQLHAQNFDVSDPDFSPASKSGFLAAASAVLEHIPDDQIDYAYEKIHALLDSAMEKQDKKNYGSINELLNRMILKESKDYYLKSAAQKVRMGEDAIDVAQDLIDMYDEFEGEDSFELGQKIEDMTYADAGFDMSQEDEQQEPAVINPPTEMPKSIIRRRAGAQPSRREKEQLPILSHGSNEIEETLKNVEKIDITDMDDKQAITATADQTIKGLALLAMCIEPLEMQKASINFSNQFTDMQKAEKIKLLPHVKHNIQNYKTYFLHNYDASSRKFASMFTNENELKKETIHQIRVTYDHGPSFLEAPTAEFIEVSDPIVSDYIPDDGSSIIDDLSAAAEELYSLASDKDQFMAGFNDGADFAAGFGDKPKRSDHNPDYISGFETGYEDIEGEIITLSESSYRIKTLDTETAESIYKDKLVQFKIFKLNITALQRKLGLSLNETISKLADEVVVKMIDKVKNLDYASEDDKIKEALRNTFANLVSYFDPNKGVGQKHAEGTKNYQANNSQNFFRNVKEEYREEIIKDFLELLVKKYLKGKDTHYKIYAGRKDPTDETERRKEYYKVDPLKFVKMAEDYANEQIDFGLENQKAAMLDSGQTDTDIDSPEGMLDGEIELDIAYELIEQDAEQEARGFFKKYALEFGFSGASGIRQWYIKKPERLFKMMIESLRGNRVLSDLHNKTLKTVLKIVAEQLPDIAHTRMIKNKPVVDYDLYDPEKELTAFSEEDAGTPEYEDAFERYFMKESIGDIVQALDHLKSNKGDLLSDIEVKSGDKDMPFLASPGGKIIINLNALIYDRFLVKFDKDYTDFVSDKLINDKTISLEMENILQREPTITPKIAKSLAEYFTGKKEKPDLIKTRVTDEDGDTYDQFSFKKNAEGKYPNKGGAAKLLAQGIDGNTFNYLFNKVSTHLKDTALQSFKPTIEFEQQRKADILKNYKNSIVDKMLENFDEKGVKVQIHNAVKEIVSFYR